MERTPGEESLRSILDRLTAAPSWRPAKALQLVDAAWPQVVGQWLAGHTRIIAYHDGRLVVAVPSAVWAQEFTYLKPTILARLKAQDPSIAEIVKDIQTRVHRPRIFSSSPAFHQERSFPGAGKRASLVQERDLPVLLMKVKEQYEGAARQWLQEGYHRCAQCHSPTLASYSLCVMCEWQSRSQQG